MSRIAIGLVLAVLVAWVTRQLGDDGHAGWAGNVHTVAQIFGDLFVGALKAVAPVLVFVLVMAAISQHRQGTSTNMRPVLVLYLLGTFAAALVAVTASFLFPSTLTLSGVEISQEAAPGGIGTVLRDLLMKLVSNPIQALANANYIGILAWALVLGASFRHAGDKTRAVLDDTAEAVSKVVRFVIGFAPLGIFGLLLGTLLTDDGFSRILQYLQLRWYW